MALTCRCWIDDEHSNYGDIASGVDMATMTYVPSDIGGGFFTDFQPPASGSTDNGKAWLWNSATGKFQPSALILSSTSLAFTDASSGVRSSLTLNGSTYNGTYNTVFFWRHNWRDGAIVEAGEHMFGHALELNYVIGPSNYIEWNFDHQKPGSERVFRYMAFIQNRTASDESAAEWAFVGSNLKLYQKHLGVTQPSFSFLSNANEYTAIFNFANTSSSATSEFSISAAGAANQARWFRFGRDKEIVVDGDQNTLGLNTGSTPTVAQFDIAGSKSIGIYFSTTAANPTSLRQESGGGGDGNYINFADTTIGGNTAGRAFLRYTRTSANQMDFSIFVSNDSAISIEAAKFTHNKIRLYKAIDPDRWGFANNVPIGNESMGGNALTHTTGDTGYYNVAIGNSTLYNITSGFQNTAVGFASCFRVTTGSFNVGIGSNSVFNATTASYNIGIGGYSLVQATGGQNVAIGYAALGTLGSANNCVAIGYLAGYAETASGRLHIANTDTKSLIIGDFSNNTLALGHTSLVTPTAILHLAAGNTTRAQMRFIDGVAPSTPSDGDLWREGNDLKIRFGSTTYTIQKA